MEEPTVQHRLESSDHIQNFVIHLFRSETGREIGLRERLDVTTNGAVVVTTGLISFSFTNADVSHTILLANVFVLFIFMLVEARRYQVHASLKQRVRSIEKTYIAPLLNQIAVPPRDIDHQPYIDPDLVNSLLDHKSPIKRFEAIVLRLHSIYIYLFIVTYIFWMNSILSDSMGQPLLNHVNQQATVGTIPGTIIFSLFTIFLLIVVILSLYGTRLSNHVDFS